MATLAPMYGSVFVSQSSYFCCHTLFRMYTYISTWIYVYFNPMSGPPPMDSYMESWVPLCVTACVSQSPYFCCYTLFRMCPIHSACGSTPCLESVHASVHEFMSTWLLMCGPPPMHSLMETWVPLYGSVSVFQSSHFCCHTLFRMCTCISTWIYVYLTPHVWSTPYR